MNDHLETNMGEGLFDLYLQLPPVEIGRTLRLCSLFSGCGGMDLGFLGGFSYLGEEYPKTGYELVYANDFDPDAKMCYRSNLRLLGDHVFDDRDISAIRDLDAIPDFDVLTAGFPCQPFSSAGNRGGVKDKHGRGLLFEEIERFIAKRKPCAFVFENVRGILSSKMPDGTPVTEEIRRRVTEVRCADNELLTYNVSAATLLNASNYGVPQQRYRVFIVGVRSDLLPFSFESLYRYVRSGQMDKRKLREALRGVHGLPNQEEVWVFSPQQASMMKHIKRSWKDVPYELLPARFRRIRDQIKKYRAPNFYRRFGWDEIAGTITASAQPENCGILYPDPATTRRFTIREIARIQSFPDDYIFNARSVQGKYKVIGNAVPPVLAFVIACGLKESFASQRSIVSVGEPTAALPQHAVQASLI